MIIIFGLRRLRKGMGPIALRCANCGWSPLALFRVSTWFALFFIPLIPVSFKHYVACPNCKRLDQVSKADIDQALARQGTPDVQRQPQPATLEHAVNQWAGGGAVQTANAEPGSALAPLPPPPPVPVASPPPLPPAGWYPDPAGDATQRYWDGQAWTEHTAPAPAPSTEL